MIRTFIDSDMFLLTLTVGLYCGGVALHHRLRLAILPRRCWRSSR